MAIVLPKFSAHRPSPAHGSAKQPAVNVSLCRDDASYCAGGYLQASWRVSRISPDELQGVEISVLWHTEGKGDEDLGVHFFRRYKESELQSLRIGENQPIQCRLPASPLSYRGTLIKIQWGVRVRIFVQDGPEAVAQHPFYLVARKPRPVMIADDTNESIKQPPRVDVLPMRHRLPAVIRQWRLKPSDRHFGSS